MAKNPLGTFSGLNSEKNKNIKAWPKKVRIKKVYLKDYLYIIKKNCYKIFYK